MLELFVESPLNPKRGTMANRDQSVGIFGKIAHESFRLWIKVKRRTEQERLLGQVNAVSVNLPDHVLKRIQRI